MSQDDPCFKLHTLHRNKDVEENDVILFDAVDDLERAVHKIQMEISRQTSADITFMEKAFSEGGTRNLTLLVVATLKT